MPIDTPPTVPHIAKQNTPAAALANLLNYMEEDEAKHFVESGQPAGHILYDVLALIKESTTLDPQGPFKLSPQGHDALGRILEQRYTAEHRHWMEAGRPENHIFSDILVLGREQIKFRAMEVAAPQVGREVEAEANALRNPLPAPTVMPEPAKAKPGVSTPGMG